MRPSRAHARIRTQTDALLSSAMITAGLLLDLDSRYGITQASGVSSWADANPLSANVGMAFTPLSTNPSYTATDPSVGGQPSVTFVVGNALRNTPGPTIAQPYTAYIVGSVTGNGGVGFLEANNTNIEGPLVRGPDSYWSYYLGAAYVNGSTVPSTGICAHALIANGASSALYVNTSSAPNASGNAGTSAINTFFQLGFAATYAGVWARLILSSGAHTTAQVAQMFRYLSALYGGSWG